MSCEWINCTLGDAITFQRGYDLPRSEMINGEYPVVGSNGIIGYHNEFTTEKPSVSIGRSGNVGNPFIVDSRSWSHNTALYIKEYKDCDPYFVYYLLKTLDLGSYANGSAVPTLNRNHIHTLPVYIPTLAEQREIAKILYSLDNKIALNTKINRHLEQMAQAIFKSWFVDFEPWGGEMPDNWKEATFSEVISTTMGGDWGKDAPTGNNTQEVYCVRGADIPDVICGNKGKMSIRFILPKNYSAKRLAVGDIVVEISGGSPTQSTGRCALITQSLLERYDRDMVCTNFCRAIKPLDKYSTFVYFYWKHLYDQNVMFSYENGTTGIKNLDITGFLENEPIIIPSIDVVIQFAKAVETFIDTIFANGLENEGLANLRDTLLPRLLSGEIQVPLEV